MKPIAPIKINNLALILPFHFFYKIWILFMGLSFLLNFQSKDVQLISQEQFNNWSRIQCHSSPELDFAFFVKSHCYIYADTKPNGVLFTPLLTHKWDNYELEFAVRRIKGIHTFCGISFPVKSIHQQVQLHLGGWGGDINGISWIDNKPANDNITTIQKKFDSEVWYDIKIKITPLNLEISINNQNIIKLNYTEHKLSTLTPLSNIPHTFAIFTDRSNAEFKDMIYRCLD
jgi:hypothetical protein